MFSLYLVSCSRWLELSPIRLFSSDADHREVLQWYTHRYHEYRYIYV